MFGYIVVNQAEMKYKEFDVYHSYYCGLCRRLKEKYGIAGQLSLSYDMTFLLMVLTGVYDPETDVDSCRCIAHPFEKHTTRINAFTDYMADMNVLFTYYKCQDDWKMRRSLISIYMGGSWRERVSGPGRSMRKSFGILIFSCMKCRMQKNQAMGMWIPWRGFSDRSCPRSWYARRTSGVRI